MNGLGIAAVALVMAVGLVGTIVPLLPGLPLVWAAGLVYGFVAGFGAVGWIVMTLMTVLLIGATIVKLVLPHRRAAGGGAPTSTLAAGAVLGVIGFFVIPIVGLPVGAALGVLLAEHRRLGDWGRARQATREVLVGFGTGALVELSAGIAMVACWIAWVLIAS